MRPRTRVPACAPMAKYELYERLGVGRDATEADIKKAYYREARQCHPDKNPGDAEATLKFQKLSEIYQVLSDPELRKKYDREGKDALGEPKQFQMDPTAFFSLLFGSERFVPWTGELYIAMQADHFVKCAEMDEDACLDGDPEAVPLKRWCCLNSQQVLLMTSSKRRVWLTAWCVSMGCLTNWALSR